MAFAGPTPAGAKSAFRLQRSLSAMDVGEIDAFFKAVWPGDGRACLF